jgi:CDGSH-type Zn-finger protein
MTEEAVVAQKQPYAVDVEAGQTYYWCRCGRSQSQPFCDGSHQGTGFEPVAFNAEKTGTVYLCGCKHTGDQPFCDGSHDKL